MVHECRISDEMIHVLRMRSQIFFYLIYLDFFDNGLKFDDANFHIII